MDYKDPTFNQIKIVRLCDFSRYGIVIARIKIIIIIKILDILSGLNS